MGFLEHIMQEEERLKGGEGEGEVGLRDLSIFNQAMLAKTCWRILNNPATLMSLDLKHKWFPDCSFHEGTKGKNASSCG